MIAINTDIIIANVGVDIGKNVFHTKGTIVLRERLTRTALPKRLANIPPCLIGMEACAGAHHIGRKLASLVDASEICQAVSEGPQE
jgi:transposase